MTRNSNEIATKLFRKIECTHADGQFIQEIKVHRMIPQNEVGCNTMILARIIIGLDTNCQYPKYMGTIQKWKELKPISLNNRNEK
jgi:hypothetical protein